jgi:hypothetical protein
MLKKCLSVILCFAAFFGIMIFPSDSIEVSSIKVPDRSTSFELYSKNVGLMRDLETNKEALFDYDVPDDGVTLVVFFDSSGNSNNSIQFFTSLSATKWANNEKMNIVAVDYCKNSASTVKKFLSTYDTQNAVDSAFYSTENNYVPYWYCTLIERNGEMKDVYEIGGAFASVFLLVVTKENGTKYIRYNLMGQKDVDYLHNYLNDYLDTGESSINLVELTVVGNLHYEYIMPIVESVNKERKKDGASTLTMSAELSKLAMLRAMESSINWTHTRPDGTLCLTVTLNGKGYSGVILAENIAAVHKTPEAVMESWMKSEGHRTNIMNNDFKQIGVGCFETADIFYWVQLFGDGNDTSMLKSSLYPNEVPFYRTLENAECVIPVYENLMGYFMIGTDIGISASTAQAGKYTDISLPYFYARNNATNQLIACFEPYVTSEDENGKEYIVPPTGDFDSGLGMTVVSDRSIYTPRAAEGVVLVSPYKGSRLVFDMPLTVVGDGDNQGTTPAEGLAGDVNNDGKVNARDVTTLMKAIIGNRSKSFNEQNADVNNDGKINARDVTTLMKRLVVS